MWLIFKPPNMSGITLVFPRVAAAGHIIVSIKKLQMKNLFKLNNSSRLVYKHGNVHNLL